MENKDWFELPMIDINNTNIVFTLHGLCKDSLIDQEYTLHVDNKTEQIQWKGIGKTMIEKNINSRHWEIREVQDPFQELLVLDPGNQVYPLGLHTWKIINSDLTLSTELSLLFSFCNETEFSCYNANCILLEKRCDNFPDCLDKSDEVDCHTISTAAATYKGYEVEFPTIPRKNEELNLFINVDVDQIVDIKDMDLRFVAKLTVTIKWFDVQLTWINLKSEDAMNFLNSEEKKMIWIPKVNFGNSEYIEPFQVDESAAVYVQKKTKGESRLYPNEVRRALYHNGSENPLTYQRSFQEVFFCKFDYIWFPFDTQHCRITFKPFNSFVPLVNFVPIKASYTGEKSLLVFSVEEVLFENIGQPSDEIILKIK